MNLLEELKQVAEFQSVPESELQWLAEKGTLQTYQDGEKIFAKGDQIDSWSVVLKGGINLKFLQGGNLRDMGTYVPREILGRLPYSRMRASGGEGIAVGEVILFRFYTKDFPELINRCHEVTEALVHNMTDRVRDFTKQQQLNDKMMALGKLSAGLAHELNNPSAAVIRSANELKRHLSTVPESFKRVIKIRATDEIVDKVNDLVFSKLKGHGEKVISMMEKSSLEDELNDWLAENDIHDVYEIVETFVEFGMSVKDLENVKSWLRPEDLLPVLGWLNQVMNTEKLVDDIEESAKRINTLVTSVKGYTHMDQAPEKQCVDIHLGIRNTLTMLNHKIKKNNIKLIENFQSDLPKANIFVSEMNQVWTNIIDNAIDAMEGRSGSMLEIRTQKDREFILVYIIDNGPGISADIKDKIFDPFFTTKAIGKGTGLGLEVVQQIISQHNGKVEVNSVPGRTEFSVCFPINQAA